MLKEFMIDPQFSRRNAFSVPKSPSYIRNLKHNISESIYKIYRIRKSKTQEELKKFKLFLARKRLEVN